MKRIAWIAIIVVYLFSIAIDCYIAVDIRKIVNRKARKSWLIAHWVCSTMFYLLFAISIVMQYSSAHITNPVMWILFFYLSVYIPKSAYCVVSAVLRFIRRRSTKGGNCAARIAGSIVAVLMFIAIWWGALFTRYDLELNKTEVFSHSLPDSFSGYRIVQFSDAHLGTWCEDTMFVSKLVNEINSRNADMIVFTGDLVNSETAELSPFLRILSRLKARDGVYSVLGNHDYGDYTKWKNGYERASNLELMKAWQRQMGWTLLNNNYVYIRHGNDSIVLIGVENWGEPPFKQYGNLNAAYSDNINSTGADKLFDNRFKILLTHNPEHWSQEVVPLSNIDLTLSGHTHSMQMKFPFGKRGWSPAKWKYKYWEGLYSLPNTEGDTLYLNVNGGCGEVGIPARFGNSYPEITEIVLQKR